MIKSIDLLVGNMFWRKHGKGLTLTAITEELIGKILSDDKEFALDDFDYIKLDEDWFEFCKFEYDLEMGHIIGGTWKHKKLGVIYFRPHMFFKWYFVRSGDGTKLTSVKYLHQLQMFYYSITGEKLLEV